MTSTNEGMQRVLFEEDLGDDQTLSLAGGASWGVVQSIPSQPDKIGLWIGMSNDGGTISQISAAKDGSMANNGNVNKGWFLTGLGTEISVEAGTEAVNLEESKPATTVHSDNCSSNIGINAGFFGDAPTAGGSISKTSTVSYTDIGYDNCSDVSAATLRVLQYLGVNAQGDAVKADDDNGPLTWALNKNPDGDFQSGILEGFFDTSNPFALWNHDVPQVAVSGQLVPTQGLWTFDKGYKGAVIVSLTFYVSIATVIGNFPPMIEAYEFGESFTIDFSKVKVLGGV